MIIKLVFDPHTISTQYLNIFLMYDKIINISDWYNQTTNKTAKLKFLESLISCWNVMLYIQQSELVVSINSCLYVSKFLSLNI